VEPAYRTEVPVPEPADRQIPDIWKLPVIR
jgi:hypothetical protein